MTPRDKAISFLDRQGRPLDAALTRYVCASGPRDAVIAELAKYQNKDGGFGRNLEVDIKAPDSQPFAARMALHVLHVVGANRDEPIVQHLEGWLEREQDEDGCWRFSPGVYEHDLASWFKAWQFPSLNPALDLAGAAAQIGIGSERLHSRVAALADRLASLEAVDSADFYTLLPYVEYFPWVDHPRREQYVERIAARIEHVARAGGYDDAQHFFEHLGPRDGDLARRLPPDLIANQLDRLRAEQQDDGGWPTPYDQAWGSWATATNAITLQQYKAD
ncbi:MAG: hypothetical protein ACRDJH_17340 [Thermomicrobiales bacterium]